LHGSSRAGKPLKSKTLCFETFRNAIFYFRADFASFLGFNTFVLSTVNADEFNNLKHQKAQKRERQTADKPKSLSSSSTLSSSSWTSFAIDVEHDTKAAVCRWALNKKFEHISQTIWKRFDWAKTKNRS